MNIWELGSGGGEQLAGLRLGLLGSISGALGICSRGQQKGLFSFESSCSWGEGEGHGCDVA